MSEKIGFIGLGLMGSRMATNLVAGGTRVVLYNRSRAKAEAVAEGRALVAGTPKEVGEQARLVFMMLTGPDAIDAVLFGEDGLLASGGRCKIIVNMSTVPPAYNKKLALRLKEKGVVLLEAPVSGSTDAAAAGSLVILTGGDAVHLEEVAEYLLLMAAKLVYCGELGQATSMKLVINQLLAIMLTVLSETVSLGEKCGLASDKVLDAILAGPLGCGFFKLKAEMIKKDTYPAGFPVKHMLKDLHFIKKTADEAGAKVPLVNSVKELYDQAMALGLGEHDFAAIKKVFET